MRTVCASHLYKSFMQIFAKPPPRSCAAASSRSTAPYVLASVDRAGGWRGLCAEWGCSLRSGASSPAPRAAAFCPIGGAPRDLLRHLAVPLPIACPSVSAACLCESQSISCVGGAAAASPERVARTGTFCASSPSGRAVIWLRNCWNEKTEQLSLAVFASLLFSIQQPSS